MKNNRKYKREYFTIGGVSLMKRLRGTNQLNQTVCAGQMKDPKIINCGTFLSSFLFASKKLK